MTDIREETNTQEQAAQEELQPLAEAPLPLPEGSTVIQCVLTKNEENGEFELAIQGVLIGSQEFDQYNPCHRFLAAVCERLPELMDKIGGTSVERVQAVAANDATVGDDAAAG